MSAALAHRDAIAESLRWEHAAHGWRLMAVEGIHALHAAKRRERALEAQLAALRHELRSVQSGTDVIRPINIMYEVVDAFEQRQKESKYAPISDGKVYKVTTQSVGAKSEKNLSMALRSFAKRKHLDAHIQTGSGYVIVQMKPKF